MGAESETPNPKPNPIVFLDFHVRDDKVGRVVLELDTKSAPLTCENFRALCTGEHGIGKAGHPLCFKGSLIHKVVPNILLQGGDITNHDGTGGDTIYGQVYTEDINPDGLKFEQAGILGLANSVDRRDENTSQFFITVDSCPHLEGSNIAFGKVLKGLDIVRELCRFENVDNVPVEKIEVGDCGEIPPGQDWGYIENDGTADIYPPYPEDWERPPSDDVAEQAAQATQAAKSIKDSGNLFFKDKKYYTATRKYEKALRYLDWAKKVNSSIDVDHDQYTTLLLNLAATKLKLKKYSEARKLCTAAILRNPNLAKAYFRRGKANFHLNEYDAAIEDLKKAYELDPNNHIQNEIAKVKNAVKEYLEEEKKTYAAMLK